MERLHHFFKLAIRQLRRSPGYSLTVLFTLALAIGANTAIVSVVNALLLRDLPYSHPGRIGAIYARAAGSESSAGEENIDGEQWELLRDNVPSVIAGISSLQTSGVNLQYGTGLSALFRRIGPSSVDWPRLFRRRGSAPRPKSSHLELWLVALKL